MPIYRYRCIDCQAEDELLLSMKEAEETLYCKKCEGVLERLMSTTTFRMKSSGRGMVLDTLNREHKILPPEQVEIMAGGLESPSKPAVGRGFG